MAEKTNQSYQQSAGNTSQLLALMAQRIAEDENRRDLEMEYAIAEGTASFDDQIEYLQDKSIWYFSGTSKYQAIQNEIQSVEEQRDETDLQYRYKIGEINDSDLLEYRQEQLSEVKEGSERYYALQNEIFDIQDRMQEKADNAEYQQQILDYKYNYTSASDFLTYLEDRLEYMNGDGFALYTDEERAAMELQVTEQEYVIADLSDEMEAVATDIQYKNGIDRLEASNQYITDLEDRLASERDPVEKIRIQGQITAQQEISRQIERDREEANIRIQYARKEITEQDMYESLNAFAEGEIDPDKKLQYELEASKQYRVVQTQNFDEALAAAQNEYAVNQNESTYLARLQTMQDTYGEDSEFGFKLDSLIASQTRRVMNDDFESALAGVQNTFAENQNSEEYLSQLESLREEYGSDSIFGVKLDALIAQQTGTVNEQQMTAEMSTLANQLLLGEITEEQYRQGVEDVYSNYDFTNSLEYQTKKESILSSSLRNDMENKFNDKMAELDNKLATGQLNSQEYEAALETVQSNAESLGFGSLMNLPQYANRFDSVLSKVKGDNIRQEMSDQVNDIKDRYASKDISYSEYLSELKTLDQSLANENPGLYEQYFKANMKGMIADATGDKKTKDFYNELSTLKNKYNNHEFNSGPVKNAKAYKDKLSEMLSAYSSGSDEYTELQNEITGMNNTIVDMQFANEFAKASNEYELNPTAKGLEKYLNTLNDLATKNKYASRQDIKNRINSEIASASGNLEEAQFRNDLSKAQNQLLNGKINAAEYSSQISALKDQYFGKDVEVKLSDNLKEMINLEVKGEEGSVIQKQFSRRLSDLQEAFERGNLTRQEMADKLQAWRSDGRWGTGENIDDQISQQLTIVQTGIAEERYTQYQERQTKRLESAQEAAARQFATAEKEFENVQSSYQAGKTSFEDYETARKAQAERQKRLEEYRTATQKIEIPEFKFEDFKPGVDDMADIELPEFNL